MALLSASSLAAILLSGGATFLGALPVVWLREVNQKATTILLGFGGGVMLAATAFSLLIPGLDLALQQYETKFWVLLVLITGMGLGSLLLSLIHRWLPHEHFIKGVDGENVRQLARVWLFVIAIALHNFPEGLAVGVSFGSENEQLGFVTALGIGLQNFPEGLIVAMALVSESYSLRYALAVSMVTALIEPLASFLGLAIVQIAQTALPWALTFAAGAMLFVICDEIIPETHQRGQENEGTIGIIVGFTLLVVLTIIFGN